MSELCIGNRRVGANSKPFVIAEAGINHNGVLDRAFSLIEIAKSSGADAVKFQTYKAQEVVGDKSLQYTYTSQGKTVTESMLEMFQRCEFSANDWWSIKKHCDKVGITFLSTPSGVSDLELLLEIGVEALKVSSDDLVYLPLIKRFAQTGLPIIASCGMSNLSEVYQALETIGTFEGYPTAVLVCTSRYPTPKAEANLKRVVSLANAFPGLIVGFSDHTQGTAAASIASALGACIFEKHFTDDHNAPGPDQWFSDDPTQLKEWIEAIRDARVLMGDGLVRPTKSERDMLPELRRVVVASADINAGDWLSEENIALKKIRHTNALPASIFEFMLRTKARRDYRSGEAIEI